LHDAAKPAGSVSRSSGGSRSNRGGRLSYPRACRLLRSAEFDAVYDGGRRRASKQFVVFFRPSPAHPNRRDGPGPSDAAESRGSSRFGISVKRALGGAVVRNRLKRRIREILRLHRQEIATGWDIVIHPRSSVATAPFGALEQELVELLKSALK
jgi:ribonuclease P protein component